MPSWPVSDYKSGLGISRAFARRRNSFLALLFTALTACIVLQVSSTYWLYSSFFSRHTSIVESVTVGKTHREPAMTSTNMLRPVKAIVKGQKLREGGGVIITRTLGTEALRNLDPFLMLDELRMPASQAFAGFPDHPHRGFETCSIMLEGIMEHRDSAGNHGVVESGGVQWMTAGRGVVHSEMPKVTEGNLHGFQLWINLPKASKFVKPRYQDYKPAEIPHAQLDNGIVRVMAGTIHGITGPIEMRNPGQLAEIQLKANGTFTHDVPEDFNAFLYVSDGPVTVNGRTAQKEHAVVMEKEGTTLDVKAGADGARLLLVAGKPIGEPIVQHGPFVMNTMAEIQQAFMDYQTGKLQNPNDDVWAKWDE